MLRIASTPWKAKWTCDFSYMCIIRWMASWQCVWIHKSTVQTRVLPITHCVKQLQNWRFGMKLICSRPVVFSYSKIYVSYMYIQHISGNKTSILELLWQHFSRINPIVPFVNISARGTLSIIRNQGVLTFHYNKPMKPGSSSLKSDQFCSILNPTVNIFWKARQLSNK